MMRLFPYLESDLKLTLVVDIGRAEVGDGNETVAEVIGHVDLRGQGRRSSQRVENCFRHAAREVKFSSC